MDYGGPRDNRSSLLIFRLFIHVFIYLFGMEENTA